MANCCPKECVMVDYCQGKKLGSINTNTVFQILYEHYKQAIDSYFYQKTAPFGRSCAEDLTQETFTKAYLKIAKLKDYCNVRSWLYVIAKNTFIDYWRKNRKELLQASPIDLKTSTLATKKNIPLLHLLQNETRKQLLEIINNLPPKYLKAIYLYDQENYTYAQAAKIMNLSIAAYTSLLNRARVRLQEVTIAQLFSLNKEFLSKEEYATIKKWIANLQLTADFAELINYGMLAHFQQQADMYNSFHQYNYHSLIDPYILGKYSLNKNDRAADFGMGTGIFTTKLSRYVHSVHGYDFSSEMCQLAQKRFQAERINNIVCQNVNFMELNLGNSKYDHAYCLTVLHHIAYPQQAVEKMVQFLKKGGKLIISDFYKHKYMELVTENSDLWYGFNKEQFSGFLTTAGLKNVWVEVHQELPITFRTKTGKIGKIPTIIGGGEK